MDARFCSLSMAKNSLSIFMTLSVFRFSVSVQHAFGGPQPPARILAGGEKGQRTEPVGFSPPPVWTPKMGHRGGSGWRESGFLAIKRDLSGKTREKRWFPPGYGWSGTGYGRLRTGYGRFVTGNGWLRTGHGRFVTGNGWLRTGNRRQRTGRCWRQFRRRWWQPSRKSADAGTVGARGGEAFAKLFPKLSCRERRQNIQDLCRWKMLAWQKGTVFCHPAGGSFGAARQKIMDKGRPPLILSKP